MKIFEIKNQEFSVGSQGEIVAEINGILKKLKFPSSNQPQIYNEQTKEGVWQFQQKYGLTMVDGIVGPETIGHFYNALFNNSKPAAPQQDQKQTAPAPLTGGKIMKGYQNGKSYDIELTPIGGNHFLSKPAAIAFLQMKRAAEEAGFTVKINSSFRSMDSQTYLYNLYLEGKGNLAAKPGYSNHQSGIALDINIYSREFYNWLNQNAIKFGFIRTVASENWHWEYRPGEQKKIASAKLENLLLDEHRSMAEKTKELKNRSSYYANEFLKTKNSDLLLWFVENYIHKYSVLNLSAIMQAALSNKNMPAEGFKQALEYGYPMRDLISLESFNNASDEDEELKEMRDEALKFRKAIDNFIKEHKRK